MARGRWSSRLAAATVAAMVLSASIPAHATAESLMLLKRRRRKKKPDMTPAKAAELRQDVQGRAGALLQTGQPGAAGVEFDKAAAAQGDPVLYLDAGDAYFAGAQQDREIELCDAAIERANISQDILYFHLDSAADPGFKFVDTSEVPGLIARAQQLVKDAEALREEIEAEQAPPPPPPPEEKKKKKRKPGQIKIIAGAASTVLGIGFLGLGGAGLGLGFARQRDAVDPTVYGEEYDDVESRGNRANLMAYIGLPVGAVLTGVGVTLIVLGRKDRRKAGGADEPTPSDDEDESEDDEEEVGTDLAVSPWWGRGSGGISLSGRF